MGEIDEIGDIVAAVPLMAGVELFGFEVLAEGRGDDCAAEQLLDELATVAERWAGRRSGSRVLSIDALLRPVTNRICSIPFETSSSTTYCTIGLRATGSISFGCDLVAGNRRVPRPATGTTAL